MMGPQTLSLMHVKKCGRVSSHNGTQASNEGRQGGGGRQRTI